MLAEIPLQAKDWTKLWLCLVKDFAVLFDWFSIFQNKWMFYFGYLQLYAIV